MAGDSLANVTIKILVEVSERQRVESRDSLREDERGNNCALLAPTRSPSHWLHLIYNVNPSHFFSNSRVRRK